MRCLIDMTGQKCGRWLVLSRAKNKHRFGHARWHCVCECGRERVVLGYNLRRGRSRSCDCLQREIQRALRAGAKVNETHGHTKNGKRTREWLAWRYRRSTDKTFPGFRCFLKMVGFAPTQQSRLIQQKKGNFLWVLEKKYQQADDAARVLKSKIWKAAAEFVRRHPEFIPSAANEKILLDCMGAPENDHLSPLSVNSWEDAYALSREKLYEGPAVRKQTSRRVAPSASGLTLDEVNSWSSRELQRQMESSPRRAAEIEAAFARR